MAKRFERLTTRKTLLGTAAVAVLVTVNAPAVTGFAKHVHHHWEINRPEYKARYGHWSLASLPDKYQLNSIHAILLHTGKVLLIAGSGNNVKQFDGGVFKSTLWDPATDTFKKIDTPADLFCGGHAQLPDGKVLVAGGTARYEALEGDVKRAAARCSSRTRIPTAPGPSPRAHSSGPRPASSTAPSSPCACPPRRRRPPGGAAA